MIFPRPSTDIIWSITADSSNVSDEIVWLGKIVDLYRSIEEIEAEIECPTELNFRTLIVIDTQLIKTVDSLT